MREKTASSMKTRNLAASPKSKVGKGAVVAAVGLGVAGIWLLSNVPGRAANRAHRSSIEAERATTPGSAAHAVARYAAPAASAAEASAVLVRIQSAVARAAAQFHAYLDAHPSKLHEMCMRGATPEEYRKEAEAARAILQAASPRPIGQVILPPPDPGCRASYDGWISGAVTDVLLGSELTDEAALAKMQGGASDEETVTALGSIAAGSEDEGERLTALMLLSRSTKEKKALPRAAYDGLAAKSPTEIQLALDAHSAVALPEGAVDSVRALVADDTQPTYVKKSALTALAHPGTAEVLGDVIHSLGPDLSKSRDVLGDLGPALATCGTPCLGLVKQLAASPDEGLRFGAYRAGMEAQHADRQAFREAILKSASFAGPLGEEEARLRQDMLSRTDDR